MVSAYSCCFPGAEADSLCVCGSLFEIWIALLLRASGCQLDIIMPPSRRQSFFESISKAMCAVELEAADASVKADKEAIHKLVREDMGFDEVNNAVMAALRGWLLHAAKAELAATPEAELGGALKLMGAVCKLLRYQGKYEEYNQLAERRLTIAEKTHDPDHPMVGRACLDASGLSSFSSDEKLATRKRALAIAEKNGFLQEAAEACRVMADGHMQRYQYSEAFPLYQRVLAINEDLHGATDRRVASCLSNLAICHRRMGNLDEALQLYERSIGIIEKEYGPDHPKMATRVSTQRQQSDSSARSRSGGGRSARSTRSQRAVRTNSAIVAPTCSNAPWHAAGRGLIKLFNHK